MTSRQTFPYATGLALLAAAACSAETKDSPATSVSETSAAVSSCTGDWTLVDSPNAGSQDNALAAVAGARPNDVWAVGQAAPDANPNMTLTLALHFDGSAWSVIDTPNAGTHANALLGVAAQGRLAWAAGYRIGDDFLSHSLIESWDGTAWSVTDHPQPFDTENLYAVAASSPNDVWAVGSGRDDEGPFHTLALHFDGRAWSVVPTPNPGTTGNVLYGVVAVRKNDAWAVGQTLGDAGPDQPLVEHWDGDHWSVVPVATGSSASLQLIGVDAAPGDDVRAVGDSQDGVVSLRTLALRSEGDAFSVQDTTNPSVRDDRLTGVAAVGDDESWAVGSFLDAVSGNLRTLIETGGEGGVWTPVTSPNPNDDGDNQLAAVARVGGRDLWAVGAFDGPDAAQTLIVHRCK
jgi:hypothetical protein